MIGWQLIAGLGGEHVVEFSLDASTEPSLSDAWTSLPGVIDYKQRDGQFHLSVTEPHIAIPALIERLQKTDRQLVSLTTRHASLEDVFVKITGRTIDEADEGLAT